MWGGRSLQHIFFYGSQHPAGMVRKNQKCFRLHALPHLSMLLMEQKIKLMPLVLFYIGYFCMWEVKHSAVVPPEGACSLVLPLLPRLPVSLGWWSSGESLFSALLGKSRAGTLLSIHHWAAEEIHFNCTGASQLNAEFPFFQRRCSISSWRSENSIWLSFALR